MARQMPRHRRITPEESVNAVSNLINKGMGNLVGSMIEKVKLGGKPGSGMHTATQTGARGKARRRAMTKGIVASREY